MADHLTRVVESARPDLLFDEGLEIGSQGNTRWHITLQEHLLITDANTRCTNWPSPGLRQCRRNVTRPVAGREAMSALHFLSIY